MQPSTSQSSNETSRQAARRERSLNKMPAMQRVAMELEKASASPSGANAGYKDSNIKNSIEIEPEDSDAGVGCTIGALPPPLRLTNGAFQSAVEVIESDTVS
jgi:hypothetical protein